MAVAQMPPELAPFAPLDEHPDLFYEVTQQQEGWGTTTGWVHVHWLGDWEVSGEAIQTTVERITISHDSDLRLPPVLEVLQLRFDAQGLAMVGNRMITAELPDEVIECPEGLWILPLPLETGAIRTTEDSAHRVRLEVLATDAPSPNSVVTDAPCVQTLTISIERRTSGAVAVNVSEAWFAPGLGVVRVEEASGVPGDLIWEELPAEALEALSEQRSTLRHHATLQMVPPAP
jgi:hypothetical protein